MAKQLLFSDEARRKILSGVEQLSEAVKTTLGPKGRNVIIDRRFGGPIVTKDGVTVAREIELEDKFENMGAQMVKEVAEKTADLAGDGTTTATVLAESIYREGLKNVTAGANPMALKRGIDKAVEAAVKKIAELAQPVKIDETNEVEQVASIASNNDTTIGALIADAFKHVGREGVVTVEESKTSQTQLKVVDGMQFDQGYMSPYFVTNGERMFAEHEDVFVLVYDKVIMTIKQMLPLLEKVAKTGRPLLIICENIEHDALATLIVNYVKKILITVAVRAPGYGDRRKAMLDDIAILCGCEVVSEEKGMKLETVEVTALGRAKRVRIDKDKTTIVEGAAKEKPMQDRINQIKNLIEAAEGDYNKNKEKERLAKLTGGVAIIKVGAATESEMKEKKDRVEDALHATRAAIEEGIVPGGGVALLRTREAIEGLELKGDEATGRDIVLRAIESPIRQLCANAGLEGSVIVENLRYTDDLRGYDISTNQYVNMLESGVIDPAKVTRTALQNAASIAGLLLTTEAMITDIPQKDAQPAMPQMPYHM